ncbi:UDP-2,4-diacetamido-2,4,6-trideoxy-beta-L-altropyranose hydrolase [Alkalimonas sp.]|uniref:UDP-2,4-diacetamido-2,4, 6-trideoxy-beta-L-altropyranose hydrolase n=1 Tax=Alkalimonas sp. TaxID=1872453 RepID=UPI00263AE939|nr:UDP-2,4-diacetamido-2,4,6-trideoxy-beta-L-altropyranose hydrolase [Alkalimonas sp.]MCC5827204.1 UDP-2,4-diacetamido-2,4,6-trideoxy-beta-L-altropyranose hydrolase [Alkalimonas sp.]
MKICIRTDSSNRIGSGHMMRCLTLAKALRQQGADVHFFCRPHPGHSILLVEHAGFQVTVLPLHSASNQLSGYQEWLGCTEAEDAIDCLRQLHAPVDWLIVDHYGLAANFCHAMRTSCQRILVIDDLANRHHDCDLLLDQNLVPDYLQRYDSLLAPKTPRLLGPAYALLRDEFYQNETVKREPGRLLVFFGGSDPFGLTRKAIEAIRQLELTPLHADIVIGQSHPEHDQLQQLCDSSSRLQLHVQCSTMATLMRQAQLMLGAGGSTHWERCITALPGLIVTVADNQIATTEYLHTSGACHWLGAAEQQTIAGFKSALHDWLQQSEQLELMGRRAASLVPLSGGPRAVLKHLLS